jgi:hypothetical protein
MQKRRKGTKYYLAHNFSCKSIQTSNTQYVYIRIFILWLREVKRGLAYTDTREEFTKLRGRINQAISS